MRVKERMIIFESGAAFVDCHYLLPTIHEALQREEAPTYYAHLSQFLAVVAYPTPTPTHSSTRSYSCPQLFLMENLSLLVLFCLTDVQLSLKRDQSEC